MSKMKKMAKAVLAVALTLAMIFVPSMTGLAAEAKTTADTEFLAENGIELSCRVTRTTSTVSMDVAITNISTFALKISDLAFVYNLNGMETEDLTVTIDYAYAMFENSPYYIGVEDDTSYEWRVGDDFNSCVINADCDQILATNGSLHFVYRIRRNDWGPVSAINEVDMGLEYVGEERATTLNLVAPESLAADGTSKEYTYYITATDTEEVVSGITTTLAYFADEEGVPGTELESAPSEAGDYWVVRQSERTIIDGEMYASTTSYEKFTITDSSNTDDDQDDNDSSSFFEKLKKRIKEIVDSIFN